MAGIDTSQLDDFDGDFVPNRGLRSVPMWDTDNMQFAPVYLGKAQRWGEEFYYDYYDTEASQNTEVYQTYRSVTTPVLPAGTYLLFVQVVWRTSNAQSLLEMTLEKDGVDLFGVHQVEASASTNNDLRKYVNGEGIFVQATDGAVDLDLNYRRQGAVGSVYIFASYIRLFRIS